MPSRAEPEDSTPGVPTAQAGAPFHALGPDLILNAVEHCFGVRCTSAIAALNSYENRVYQIGVEDSAPLIVKFYRPGRWTDAAIREEHAFTILLAEREIPVVAPLSGADHDTLMTFGGFRFALFPRQGGRRPELESAEQRAWIGRFIARIHAVGAVQPFQHRSRLSITGFGLDSVQFLLDNNFIPENLQIPYRTLVADVLERVNAGFERAGPVAELRSHGDCHPSNILWTTQGPHFVDFDDCLTAPAVQDLWMLLSGERDEKTAQLADILDGYCDFNEFDARELQLIEPLRALRILHYSAWLARRWHDPSFPLNFPWFNTQRYWEDHILALREQLAVLDEPALWWN